MVLGGGTIADMISRDQRGTAMAVWMVGPSKYPSSIKYRRFPNKYLLAIGPCVGPIVGGFLTVAKGWRWNFWFVAICVRDALYHNTSTFC
jgi:MFS family permease